MTYNVFNRFRFWLQILNIMTILYSVVSTNEFKKILPQLS